MKLAATGQGRRLVRRMLVCLIVGCVANVAVAWTCIIWSPARTVTLPPIPSRRSEPPMVQGPSGVGWWHTSTGFGVRVSESLGVQLAGGEETWVRGYVGPAAPTFFDSGWPLLSMRSEVQPVSDHATGLQPVRWELPIGEILRRGPQVAELPVGSRAFLVRRLPLRPLPIGFAVNSALFGGVAWIVLAVIRRISRVWRAGARGFPISAVPGELHNPAIHRTGPAV
jgi:hypothetical protein